MNPHHQYVIKTPFVTFLGNTVIYNKALYFRFEDLFYVFSVYDGSLPRDIILGTPFPYAFKLIKKIVSDL